jgi:hypothetical protein
VIFKSPITEKHDKDIKGIQGIKLIRIPRISWVSSSMISSILLISPKTLISLITLIFSLVAIWFFPVDATTLTRGVSSSISVENSPLLEEVYRIKIENKVDGLIEVSEDKGGSWEALGKVLYPTEKISKHGYAAAMWVEAGRVAASAVNAIHIKSGAVDEERSIFSILPKDFLRPPKCYRSFLSPDSSIYTNINAGNGIFGGGFAPFVGNIVMLQSPDQQIVTLPQDYVPKVDDTFYILVEKPVDYPKEIVFENRFGGRISISYFSGDERVIGQVLRPVVGIGRFEGTRFADPGRVRANHAGVIDVSTSTYGNLGGFQIVPALHGSGTSYIKTGTQWMVIGPYKGDDPSLEGMAPFFSGFINPSYRPEDLEDENWEEKLLSRFLVQVKYEGKEKWKPMPVLEIDDFYLRRRLPSWANTALKNISHFRILFPID